MKLQIEDLGGAVRYPVLLCAVGLMACTGIVSGGSGSGSVDTPGPTGTGTGSGSTGASAANPGTGTGAGNVGTGSTPGTAAPGSTATPGTGSTAATAPFAPVPSGMRRLTATQFSNSLNALLGTVTISELDDDLYIGGFATTGASLVVTSQTGVAEYQAAIDGALDQVFTSTTRRQTLVGCQPKTPLDSACAGTFVKAFGRLAWRKSLTQDQIDHFTNLAVTSGAALSDPWAGLQWAASALLNSPNFLYRVERGAAVAGAPGLRYDGPGLASKLSFLIWNSAPDATLLDAAEQGQLSTTDGIQKQAQRLLDAPQGHEAIRNFARELINLGRLNDIAKDATSYPNYTATLPTAIAEEFVSMWEGIAFDSDVSAMELFTTQKTYVNKELGAFYGLSTAGLGDTATAVTFPASSKRSGILTSAALLALEANQKYGSPTLRGKMIREQFLCQTIPPPPDDVSTVIPELPAGVKYTKREQLVMQHETQPTCAGCHTLMDPLGFALEHFDAVGAYRDLDNGKPVDTTGSLDSSTFDGAPQLGQILAGTPAVTNCLVRNMYRYATGHQEAASEEAAIAQLGTDFAGAGSRLKALILNVVTNEGFVYAAPEQQ